MSYYDKHVKAQVAIWQELVTKRPAKNSIWEAHKQFIIEPNQGFKNGSDFDWDIQQYDLFHSNVCLDDLDWDNMTEEQNKRATEVVTWFNSLQTPDQTPDQIADNSLKSIYFYED
jgi:hypothetical protein